ncbi:hypothetical protein MASR2M117_01970 [Paludibacter sp.]
MKKGLIVLFSVLIFGTVYAQNAVPKSLESGLIPSTYSRNALTAIVLDNNCNYIDDIRKAANAFSIPEKFDDNTVQTKVIKSSSNKDDILSVINQSTLGNEILSKWFSRSAEGVFNMSLIAKRGMYNATVDDMIKASASKIGMNKIKDAGQVLVDNSYIQIIEFRDVITMKEYYDRQDAANRYKSDYKPVERTKNGWKAEAVSYLFKISPEYVNILFDELWIYEDDAPEVKIKKKELFDKTRFKFSFIMQVSHSAEGTQDNPNALTGKPVQLERNQLFNLLVNSGLKTSLYEFDAKYEPFRVKTALYAVNPLRSKIGTKEGLGVDYRFFVYENIMNSKGEVKAKRQGVIYVKKVENNSVVASTTSNIPMSKFYQTAGKRLEPGMTMQQRNDYGLGLSMGVATGSLGGFYIKAEGNLATISRLVPGTQNLLPISQLKLFGSIAFDGGDYSPNGACSFMRYQVGLSKGFYFLRNFSIVPFLAYGSESARTSTLSDGYTINTDFINLGGYFSINILYNLQFVTTLNIYTLFGNAYQKYEKETTQTYPFKYDYYFVGRSGPNLEFGLRYEL